jgi:hypothetical protein
MQPVKLLSRVLDEITERERSYLFTLSDLKSVFPEHSPGAFKALINRGEKNGIFTRVCHGLYLYAKGAGTEGLVLYHAAARLRSSAFNYLSLESVLSDAGVISQVPLQWITVMSSGRSSTIDCGRFGHIEFIHTKKSPKDVAGQLVYDSRCRMWRASLELAVRDMKAARRNMDIVDWEMIHEPL